MAFVPFTKDEQPTMAAFNEKFEQAIEQALADGTKIEVGSYVGTGTYGSSNKNSLTFSFDPKVVIIIGRGSYGSQSIFVRNAPWSIGFRIDANIGSTAATEQGYSYIKTTSNLATWGSNRLSWYHTKNADAQENTSGSTYYYAAIG